MRKSLARTENPSIKKEVAKPFIKEKPEKIDKTIKGETSRRTASKESHGATKETAKPALEEKKELIVRKPEPAGSQGKPASDFKTPLSKSQNKLKAAPKIQTTAHSTEVVSYPYSLLLYHFRSLERAKNVVSLYSKKGLTSYWVKVEFSNGIWYRVFVGYFEGREKAEQFRKDHALREAVVKKTAYAALIDTYTSSNKLTVQIQSLEDLGFSPYIIKDNNGASRLYVGTFITKEGAEIQRQDLESKGVPSQVVER